MAPRRTLPQSTTTATNNRNRTQSNTPNTTPCPTRRNGITTRSVRAISIEIAPEEAPRQTKNKASPLPPHYLLPPTTPSPFPGTLDASLDAILAWGKETATTTHIPTPGLQPITDTLLQPVRKETNWPKLLSALPRVLVEDVLFLTTRTLLPNQIAENRGALTRLYDKKKQLAIRLVLRYDMVLGWKMKPSSHQREQAITVASVPPPADPAAPGNEGNGGSKREKLLPNVITTLIAAPAGGYTTGVVRERMKHHVTDLDVCLLLDDDEVAAWSDWRLVYKTAEVMLLWQWLRANNEILEDMEVHGWEELDGRADDCEWIAEEMKTKKNGGAVGGK
ncbi:hypothetical protein BDW02DRAFT_556225 [Decorospora gaudefroyi]|uniref:Uncharacterized protein n=1 Tax=Decorospora gaudefroyi TaxID=184978 RepID=A0A6A5K5V6_9PLEO|nr:hypothetical protein BDW02DRAFT_556225 [Decorospora gaudefroyi]